MALADLNFSDLILMQNGRAFLKGTPELDQQLKPLGPELVDTTEMEGLAEAVDRAFSTRRGELENVRVRFGELTFRVANYHGVDGPAYFLRRLADRVPDLEELGLGANLTDWLVHPDRQKGLVLFCGPQSSGKTTSAAAFIASRLRRHGGHMVSLEAPVEMPLAGPQGEFGYAFQTEVKSEADLARHIERSHRYSGPNILYVGEIRSKYAASEVLRVSLGSANQLVVSTIHGLDIITALDRLMTWARELDGEVSCQNLAHSLLAIVYQELVTLDGQRELRVPETLLVPFSEKSRSIRSKLRDGKLASLAEDILEQRNRIAFQGMGAVA